MKFGLTCIYWTLLLISVISSGLLFFIVASEGIQAKHHVFLLEKSKEKVFDNVTFEENEDGHLQPLSIPTTESENQVSLKTNQKDDVAKVSASFETFSSGEARREKDLEILAESLTQQPNLSQGISETGQAVVLTLVDTAAAEFHSFVKPRSEPGFQSKSSAKNETLTTSTVTRHADQVEESIPPTQILAPPALGEATEKPNETDVLDEEDYLLVHKTIVEEVPEMVLVVRAAQKITDGSDFPLDEEIAQVISEESPKVEDVFSTASELNDSAARATLVGGSKDDAAAVLDGFISSGPTDQHEDMPSFSEWAQKRLEEAEKKKTHPNASVQTPSAPGRGVGGMKVRSKNYASPDCGAKIVAVNPEARSAKSVLASTRDEYMLNTCTSRVWFVVELCEAIQAKKIELANFELFSSSPKDFSVFVSDRFPTRDWSPVGQFTAKDEKDIQSFALYPHLFGKFIKVELHTHYGSEHFCPISLFRAYGTSEFEVLETETENQITRGTNADTDDDEDNDEEEVLDIESGGSRNLFGSARDAVLSIVKKAAEVLVKSSNMSGNNITKIQQNIDSGTIFTNSYTSCVTPRYIILCGNCSDQKFAKVFQLVSCRDRQLDDLLKIVFVKETLMQSKLCKVHGVSIGDSWQQELKYENKQTAVLEQTTDLHATFLTSVFKPEYIVALCNILVTKDRKVVMNTSYEVPAGMSEGTTGKTDTLNMKIVDDDTETAAIPPKLSTDRSSVLKPTSTKETRKRVQETSSEETAVPPIMSTETLVTSESIKSQNKLTKTLGKDDLKKESSVPILEPNKEEASQAEVVIVIPPSSNIVISTSEDSDEPSVLGTSTETTSRTGTSVPQSTSENLEFIENVGPDMELIEIGFQGKIEKLEQIEQDTKQGKVDLGDQEAKMSQEQLSLLTDLKDLEVDTINLQNGHASSTIITQPTASSTPQQKESVFLRLSNRIKALERNMSLSGQYLEELSRRYKKQVEEMQRSLERAVSTMGEEFRKGEERESKRVEEIAALREEIAILSKSVEILLYDRDSWRNKISTIGQHFLLICLDVIVVILILSYCRRADFDDEESKQVPVRKEVERRRSIENFNGQSTLKKSKKRRPSEIASHISASYHELMIEDRIQESKKERKKKRKRDTAATIKVGMNRDSKRESLRYKSVLNIVSDGSTFPSRRASSIDAPTSNDLQTQVYRRPESAPETTVGWFDDQSKQKEQVVQGNAEDNDFHVLSEQSSNLNRYIEEIRIPNTSSVTVSNSTELNERRSEFPNKSFRSSGIMKTTKLSSPSFMKTALGSRRRRKALGSTENVNRERSQTLKNVESFSGHSSDRSRHSSPTCLKTLSENNGTNDRSANGLIDESDESRSSTATPVTGKKEKKSTGLKKMVKKFF